MVQHRPTSTVDSDYTTGNPPDNRPTSNPPTGSRPAANPLAGPPVDDIDYPEDDGNPMAENTKQFEWIVTVKENLERLYANDPTVFVAGDLLWYPVKGYHTIRQAPDTMVAFGRPKGHRGSYQQWHEGDVSPQVVFEILSPGNRRGEMAKKLQFYNRYGVEEYYEYDPDRVELVGWQRQEDGLTVIDPIDNWVSPRIGIRFVLTPETLEIYRPDGGRFLTYLELSQQLDQVNHQLDEKNQQLDEKNHQLDEKNQQLALATATAERLAERLRALGVDPADLLT
jgi:Uma2 family endonuclease